MTQPKTPPARRAKVASEAPRQKRAARRQAAAAAQAPAVDSPPSPPSAPTKAAPAGKLGVVVALMRRPEGATVAQMSEATGWLPHSVRGALAGALKKKHRLSIASVAADGGRVYRIAAGPSA